MSSPVTGKPSSDQPAASCIVHLLEARWLKFAYTNMPALSICNLLWESLQMCSHMLQMRSAGKMCFQTLHRLLSTTAAHESKFGVTPTTCCKLTELACWCMSASTSMPSTGSVHSQQLRLGMTLFRFSMICHSCLSWKAPRHCQKCMTRQRQQLSRLHNKLQELNGAAELKEAEGDRNDGNHPTS